MKTARLFFVLALVALLLLAGAFIFERNRGGSSQYSQSGNRLLPATTSEQVRQTFGLCNSLPNGSTQTVKETTRMFINIPKSFYPNVNVAIISNGATAGSISNGGEYGYAMGADQNAGCWSYYFEFLGEGTVDIVSKSGTTGVPDYVLHFKVTKA